MGNMWVQGDTWHLAAELHKLDLTLNVLTFGYSVLHVEPDAVYRNPMRHLLSFKGVHSSRMRCPLTGPKECRKTPLVSL